MSIKEVATSMGADPKRSVGFLLRRNPAAHPGVDIPALVIGILRVGPVATLALPVSGQEWQELGCFLA